MHLYQIPVISPHFGFDFYKISPVWPGALQLPCFLRFQRISTLNQLISTILSSLKKAAEEAKKKARLDGKLLLSADKKRYAKGDAVKVTVKGRNLRLVNALSFALPYDPKDLEFVGVEVKNMKKMENLTNDRLHTNGTKALYPTFVNIGDKEPVEGTSELFVLKFKARRDVKFQPKLTDGMVVDKKLNTRKL